MSTLLETLGEVLVNSNSAGKLSRKIGADESTTGSALSMALPLILGALNKNSTDRNGAENLLGALSRDHDGSVLDHLDDLLDNPDNGPGDGILRHALGSNRGRVESSLGKSTGLDANSIATILKVAAPLIMGALGKSQRANHMDANALSEMLRNEEAEIQTRTPQSAGLMNMLLDQDGDGDVDLSDIAQSGLPNLLGGLFKR